MESTGNTRFISVRDRQQARDWALVLLSQGIESTVVEDENAGVVALEVETERCGAALRILKQYHVENRGWGLRRELPVVHLSFNGACLSWAAMIVVIHHLATLPGSRMTAVGVLNQSVLTASETWRLLTAMTLHNDLGHLASNLVTGLLLIGLTMARHGTGWGLLGPWLAGALANLAALFVYGDDYQSLGASGMVLAALGILTASGTSEALRHRPGWKPMFATLAAGLMLFVLTGSNPASDLMVHLGGFVFGLGVGGVLERTLRHGPESRGQTAAILTCLFSAVLAWLLALAR